MMHASKNDNQLLTILNQIRKTVTSMFILRTAYIQDHAYTNCEVHRNQQLRLQVKNILSHDFFKLIIILILGRCTNQFAGTFNEV